MLKKNASKNAPLMAPELAQVLNVDTRGISRRLPRMVGDGMIQGSATTGYWVEGRRR